MPQFSCFAVFPTGAFAVAASEGGLAASSARSQRVKPNKTVVVRLFFAKPRKTIYMNGRVKTAVAYGASAAVGLISGFFGGGGGMLCVPLLQFRGLDVKRAHATALIVILPLCIVSAAIYIANGYFDANAVMCAIIGVSIGGAAGALALDKLNGTAIGVIFAALMIAIGIKLIVA